MRRGDGGGRLDAGRGADGGRGGEAGGVAREAKAAAARPEGHQVLLPRRGRDQAAGGQRSPRRARPPGPPPQAQRGRQGGGEDGAMLLPQEAGQRAGEKRGKSTNFVGENWL